MYDLLKESQRLFSCLLLQFLFFLLLLLACSGCRAPSIASIGVVEAKDEIDEAQRLRHEKATGESLAREALWDDSRSADILRAAESFHLYRLTEEFISDYSSEKSGIRYLNRYPVVGEPRVLLRAELEVLLSLLSDKESYIHHKVAYGCGWPTPQVMMSAWDEGERLDVLFWTTCGLIWLWRDQKFVGSMALEDYKGFKALLASESFFPKNKLRQKLIAGGLLEEDFRLMYNSDGETELRVEGENVTSLEALAGLPFDSIRLRDTSVTDLSLLTSIEGLRRLYLQGELPPDFTPLEGIPLTSLQLAYWAPTDLTFVQAMPLEDILIWNPNFAINVDVLREIPTLKRINGDSEKFWRRYDAGEFEVEVDPFFDGLFE